jgi:prepilin-type N-terminal cleavage/methylation domain-containing protein
MNLSFQYRPEKTHTHKSKTQGFSLMELMITAGLIGLVASIGMRSVTWELEREQVNTVASELAGWLETVRSASQRQPGSAPCVVTFSNATPVSSGATLASVSPTTCSVEPSFQIRPLFNSNRTFTISLATPNLPTSITEVTFTPRGTISTSANTDMRIQLTGTTNMRCVRLTPTIGMIQLGSGTSTNNDCTSWLLF